MDFVLDKHSALPAYAQIQEQIKLALWMGHLRPGDTLPSIRDVEKQVGVSRNIVRRAYLQLQSSGILDLRRGKGVLVEKKLAYNHRGRIQEKSEKLSSQLIKHLRSAGISPIAFARYLYQRAREDDEAAPFLVFVDATKKLAAERANRISAIWQLKVSSMSIEELDALDEQQLSKMKKILTSYLRLDDVQRITKNREIEVIPLGFVFHERTISEFSNLPDKSSVALVLDENDFPSRHFVDAYGKALMGRTVKEIVPVPFSKVRNLDALVGSTKYQKVIVSNRLWHDLPESLKKHPHVTHIVMEVDLASLENARIRAGVII